MTDIATVPEKTSDFTELDLKAIERFEASGMPGLYQLDDPTAARMMELYLGGKTYNQISKITRTDKDLILALSKKFNWYPMRVEFLRDLNESIGLRTLEAKIVGQDFLLQLKYVFEKKIGYRLREYLRTGDESFINSIDLKEIDKYIKTLDKLDEMTATKSGKSDPKPAGPTVGINIGEGVTVNKLSENQIEISPKEKTVNSMLSNLAEYRRQEEQRNSDIKKNNSEGEKK